MYKKEIIKPKYTMLLNKSTHLNSSEYKQEKKSK